MPELPEVHTTVEGLKKIIVEKTITDVWSDFHIGSSHNKKKNIKNYAYFIKLKKIVVGAKIISIERRGKNILINLNNKYTIVIHMKMTGHLMYGVKDKWVHLVFKLKNAKDLVLSDMRKFASVTFIKTEELHLHSTVGSLGPEPLSKTFSPKILFERIQRKKSWPIKSALLDQKVLAGLGNIYTDEILWATGIHPLSIVAKIPKNKFQDIFTEMLKVLKFSISKGGDSKSDYRNAFGEKGEFQDFHKAYSNKGKKCPKKNCPSIIERIVVKGRGSYFCPIHQKLY